MKALCWHAKNDVRVDTVPDPEIQFCIKGAWMLGAGRVIAIDKVLSVKLYEICNR